MCVGCAAGFLFIQPTFSEGVVRRPVDVVGNGSLPPGSHGLQREDLISNAQKCGRLELRGSNS